MMLFLTNVNQKFYAGFIQGNVLGTLLGAIEGQ
jgi:hypothetical protein